MTDDDKMLTSYSSSPNYQVGGSLPFDAPTYVCREADELLFQGLLRGEFCYIFNARQMGKSSLRVQTTYRLKAEGIRCAVIDITTIGTQEITSEQWYGSLIGLLVKSFQLKINLLSWWRDRSHLSSVNRLSDFLETVLLEQIQEPIVIFIDEIDSVLSLNFSTDDFFALIRSCYNQRAEHPNYRRLTFALFGVATPSDLISDTNRTPFNIGLSIELKGFKSSEATPLLLESSEMTNQSKLGLERILYWTGGQPFLTQKLCQFVFKSHPKNNLSNSLIDEIVETKIINNWETNDEPEHLKTIRDRLLYNEQRAGRLLGLYQQILLRSSSQEDPLNSRGIPADNSPEQTELILSGLAEKREGIIQVKNPIYQQIFNLDWVAKQLSNNRPYSQSINAWIASGYQDESWLLRSKALQDILAWSQGKSLSDIDYQYLAASQELDRKLTQRVLEAERLKEVEARLELEQQRFIEQRRNLKRQQILLGIVSGMMLVAIALGMFAYRQYQKTALSEVKAITLSSEALLASNEAFDALLQAIKAKEGLQKLTQVDLNLKKQIDDVLWEVILNIQESNRLNGHKAAVIAVDFSRDGEQIATASVDGTIKLWTKEGTLLKTLNGHQAVIRAVKFSPDGTLIASAADDKTLKLWKRDGTLLRTIQTQTAGLWGLDFSPDGSQLISGGADSSVVLWGREGKRLKSFAGQKTGVRAVAFSPDGKTIASANIDNSIHLWNADGSSHRTWQGHPAAVYAIAFSPDSNMIISGTADGVIQRWKPDGTLLGTHTAHNAVIKELRFSPDGKLFASASWDKTVKLWKPDGTLLTTLQGHDAGVWGVAFSPDSQTIASAGAENLAILWKSQSIFQQKLNGLTGLVRGLTLNKDGTVIATSGTEKTINLWQWDGTPLQTLNAHDAAVIDISIHPQTNILASVSEDKTLKLWQLDGRLLSVFKGATSPLLSVSWHPQGEILATGSSEGKIWLWQRPGQRQTQLQGHTAPVWTVTFSPTSPILASGSDDSTVRLWNLQGQPLKVLKGHQAAVWRVAFSPDGEILVSGSADTTVKLWKPDGTLIKTLTGHKAAVWGIAFSPDGSLLATAGIDQTVKLWTREGVLLRTLKGHRSGIRAVAFHPHLPILASIADEQGIILWNLDPILNLEPYRYGCNWVRDYLKTNSEIIPENSQLCPSIRN